MKFIVAFLAVLLAAPAHANLRSCGPVSIEKVLTGPRHGAMMRVSGSCGWVCLDPNGQYMSKAESERLFAFVLSAHAQNKAVNLTVYTNKFANACRGKYPVVEDIRTK